MARPRVLFRPPLAALRSATRIPSSHPQRWLVIMAKAACAGRVKTRLARQIGTVSATRFYRATTAAVIGRLACDPRWRLVVALAPDRADWRPPPGARVLRIGQGTGDLGQRMQRLMSVLPPGPAVIVGTDIPAIRPTHIADAFARLGSARSVLGPAPDGGYWLVGMRRAPRIPNGFEPVRWSSPHALADTRAALSEAGPVALAATLPDVDDGCEWRRARDWFGRRVLPSPRHPL